MLRHVSELHSLWPRNSPLCVQTTLYSPTNLLKDMVSTFWLLGIMLLWAFTDRFLWGWFSVFLDIYSGIDLQQSAFKWYNKFFKVNKNHNHGRHWPLYVGVSHAGIPWGWHRFTQCRQLHGSPCHSDYMDIWPLCQQCLGGLEVHPIPAMILWLSICL